MNKIKNKKKNIFSIILLAIFFLVMFLMTFNKTSLAAGTYGQAECDSIYGSGYIPASDGLSCVKANSEEKDTKLVDVNVGLKDKTGSSGSDAVKFTNPLQFNTVEELLTQGLLAAIQSIIVILALVFIAIGAIMIIASTGSPETVEKGKKTIYMAILGLALGVGAPSIMKELGAIIGWSGADATALSLSQIALNVLNFLLGITGVLAITMLVVGGIMFMTSAGDEERVESGKKIFKFSLIGIVVVMASMTIVKQIARFFIAS